MLLIDVSTSPLLPAGAHYLNMLRQSLKSVQSELCMHLVLKEKDLNHFWFLCFDRVLVRYLGIKFHLIAINKLMTCPT